MATSSEDPAQHSGPVIIWDGWVRAVHWLIALLFAVSWYTHRTNLQWHRYAGYALLTLVLFRIYWGFVGSTTARFAHFVRGPVGVARHARALLRRAPSPSIGHNPIGAISVLLLLGLLLAQCVLGLLVTDADGLESGPLSPLVSFETGRTLSEWHGFLFKLLQIFVALHLVAVFAYLFAKRDNLIGPMITGRKRVAGDIPAVRLGSGWHAAIAVTTIAAIVWAVVHDS